MKALLSEVRILQFYLTWKTIELMSIIEKLAFMNPLWWLLQRQIYTVQYNLFNFGFDFDFFLGNYQRYVYVIRLNLKAKYLVTLTWGRAIKYKNENHSQATNAYPLFILHVYCKIAAIKYKECWITFIKVYYKYLYLKKKLFIFIISLKFFAKLKKRYFKLIFTSLFS